MKACTNIDLTLSSIGANWLNFSEMKNMEKQKCDNASVSHEDSEHTLQ